MQTRSEFEYVSELNTLEWNDGIDMELVEWNGMMELNFAAYRAVGDEV